MKNTITGKNIATPTVSVGNRCFRASVFVCAGVFSALPLTAKMEDVFTAGAGCMTLVGIIHFAVFQFLRGWKEPPILLRLLEMEASREPDGSESPLQGGRG